MSYLLYSPIETVFKNALIPGTARLLESSGYSQEPFSVDVFAGMGSPKETVAVSPVFGAVGPNSSAKGNERGLLQMELQTQRGSVLATYAAPEYTEDGKSVEKNSRAYSLFEVAVLVPEGSALSPASNLSQYSDLLKERLNLGDSGTHVKVGFRSRNPARLMQQGEPKYLYAQIVPKDSGEIAPIEMCRILDAAYSFVDSMK